MPELIFASKSPTKLEILKNTGLKFRVEESNFDESQPPSQNPAEVVKYLALGKARAVAKRNPDAVVIGTDTIIFHQNKIVGKPKDEADAKAMLKSYCGRFHTCYTGIALVRGSEEAVDVSSVNVFFRNLTDLEIDNYIATKEPFGKAGAYAYQYQGAALIERMEGDYYAALGMPVFKLCSLLRKFGVNPLQP
jgi:septum formation protein